RHGQEPPRLREFGIVSWYRQIDQIAGHGNPSRIGPDWLISFIVFDRSMGDKIGGRESGADLKSGSRGRSRRPPRGWAPRCHPGTARVVPGIALARGGRPSGRVGERGLLAPLVRRLAVGWVSSVGSRPAASRAGAGTGLGIRAD